MRLKLSESPATVPIVDSHLIMNELQQEQKICQQLSSTSYPGSEMPSTTWSSFFFAESNFLAKQKYSPTAYHAFRERYAGGD